jgi:hypothetical protein
VVESDPPKPVLDAGSEAGLIGSLGPHGRAQDRADLFFHAATVALGAAEEPRLDAFLTTS